MIYVECLVFPLHATSYVVGTIRTFILYEYKIKYLNLGWGTSVITWTFPVESKAALHPALQKRNFAFASFSITITETQHRHFQRFKTTYLIIP